MDKTKFLEDLYIQEVVDMTGTLLDEGYVTEDEIVEIIKEKHSLNKICEAVNEVLKENGKPLIECGKCAPKKNPKEAGDDKKSETAGTEGTKKKGAIYGLFKENISTDKIKQILKIKGE
jgi:hypothetical protein